MEDITISEQKVNVTDLENIKIMVELKKAQRWGGRDGDTTQTLISSFYIMDSEDRTKLLGQEVDKS